MATKSKTKTKKSITELLKGGYPDACKLLKRKELSLKQFAFMDDQAEAFFALHKIVTVIEAINEGHKFDWNSYADKKNYPWWDMETYGKDKPGSGFSLYDVICDHSYSSVGARLSTRSDDHTRFVAELMKSEYKIWMKK